MNEQAQTSAAPEQEQPPYRQNENGWLSIVDPRGEEVVGLHLPSGSIRIQKNRWKESAVRFWHEVGRVGATAANELAILRKALLDAFGHRTKPKTDRIAVVELGLLLDRVELELLSWKDKARALHATLQHRTSQLEETGDDLRAEKEGRRHAELAMTAIADAASSSEHEWQRRAVLAEKNDYAAMTSARRFLPDEASVSCPQEAIEILGARIEKLETELRGESSPGDKEGVHDAD